MVRRTVGEALDALTLLLVIIGIFSFGFVIGTTYDTQTSYLDNIDDVTTGGQVQNWSAPHQWSHSIQPASVPVSVRVNDFGAHITNVDTYGRVTGMSMQPTIFSGNTVLYEQYTGDQRLREGVIVRYKKENEPGHVVHRIVGNYLPTSGYLVTQGDNNDGWERINASQITHVALGVLFTPDR